MFYPKQAKKHPLSSFPNSLASCLHSVSQALRVNSLVASRCSRTVTSPLTLSLVTERKDIQEVFRVICTDLKLPYLINLLLYLVIIKKTLVNLFSRNAPSPSTRVGWIWEFVFHNSSRTHFIHGCLFRYSYGRTYKVQFSSKNRLTEMFFFLFE